MEHTSNIYAQRLTHALQAAHMCLFELDLHSHTYTFFENCEEIFGLDPQQLLELIAQYHELPVDQYHNTVFERFIHADDMEVAKAAAHEIMRGHATAFQSRIRHAQGHYQWCKINLTPIVEDGAAVRLVGVISDIQSFRARAEKLAEEARIDNFTGLYHKLHFEKIAEAILQNHADQRHGLILFDLDNFEEFNKIYGKLRGDGVLRSVSANLRSLFPKPHIVGRFGGDEFIILMQDLQNDQQLADAVAQLLHCDDSAMKVTKSVGVSVYPDDAAKFSDLLHQAEIALHHSKQQKNTSSFYTAGQE